MKKVLIFQGGWDGHEPKLVSARFGKLLEEAGYAVEIYDTQDCLADKEKLQLRTIGVGFACQMVEELPAEDWDIKPYQVICV